VVLTELMQNAADHAFPMDQVADARPEGDGAHGAGTVAVDVDNDGEWLVLRVADDGVGLPPGFSLSETRGLGLSIVRSLVTTQIEGSITMTSPVPGSDVGTVVEVRVPLTTPAGD
jgi:two-component sensor histidine kinase